MFAYFLSSCQLATSLVVPFKTRNAPTISIKNTFKSLKAFPSSWLYPHKHNNETKCELHKERTHQEKQLCSSFYFFYGCFDLETQYKPPPQMIKRKKKEVYECIAQWCLSSAKLHRSHLNSF